MGFLNLRWACLGVLEVLFITKRLASLVWKQRSRGNRKRTKNPRKILLPLKMSQCKWRSQNITFTMMFIGCPRVQTLWLTMRSSLQGRRSYWLKVKISKLSRSRQASSSLISRWCNLKEAISRLVGLKNSPQLHKQRLNQVRLTNSRCHRQQIRSTLIRKDTKALHSHRDQWEISLPYRVKNLYRVMKKTSRACY